MNVYKIIWYSHSVHFISMDHSNKIYNCVIQFSRPAFLRLWPMRKYWLQRFDDSLKNICVRQAKSIFPLSIWIHFNPIVFTYEERKKFLLWHSFQ